MGEEGEDDRDNVSATAASLLASRQLPLLAEVIMVGPVTVSLVGDEGEEEGREWTPVSSSMSDWGDSVELESTLLTTDDSTGGLGASAGALTVSSTPILGRGEG